MAKPYRHIVRIAGTDLEGSHKLEHGLTRVKGVGMNLAKAIVKVTNLDPDTMIGNLTEGDVQRIESALREVENSGVPKWLLNRRRELETGKDLHLIGSDLMLRVKSDVDFMRKIRSWKGVRHSLGLKVRGQRTKTTGRTGRSVGVRKKSIRRVGQE